MAQPSIRLAPLWSRNAAGPRLQAPAWGELSAVAHPGPGSAPL